MAKKTETEKPASWCPYCRNFVVSCTHSGGRVPTRRPKTEPEKTAKKEKGK